MQKTKPSRHDTLRSNVWVTRPILIHKGGICVLADALPRGAPNTGLGQREPTAPLVKLHLMYDRGRQERIGDDANDRMGV